MSDSAFLVLVLVLFVALVGLYVAVWVFRYRMAQARRRPGAPETRSWRLDGGLRLVSGEHPGLTRRWQHGRVTVEPGLLVLRPYLLGLRFLPKVPVSVHVAGIDLAGEQRAGLGSMVTIRPGSRLVPVTTTTGATLLLAVLATKTDEPFAALASRPAVA